MREISPSENLSITELLGKMPEALRERVIEIREQKRTNTRPHPSTNLIDRSNILSPPERAKLLDKVSELVDENLFGRSEMCKQFANLFDLALKHLGFSSRAVIGKASYFSEGKKIFQWEHAWVRIGKEVIDGNVDSLIENPFVPETVKVVPYWGPIEQTPINRRLHEDHGRTLPHDKDVSELWWPELRTWLNEELKHSNKQ